MLGKIYVTHREEILLLHISTFLKKNKLMQVLYLNQLWTYRLCRSKRSTKMHVKKRSSCRIFIAEKQLTSLILFLLQAWTSILSVDKHLYASPIIYVYDYSKKTSHGFTRLKKVDERNKYNVMKFLH